MCKEYRFELARSVDAEEILSLYHSLVGTLGCTWSEQYPCMGNVVEDIGKSSLYCLRDGKRIVAAAAAGEDDDLDHDGIAWDAGMQRPCDLARIGVLPELHGHGVGTMILKNVMLDVKKRGFDGIRMLVSKSNTPALALYDRAGFSRCGDVFKYDIDFYCYQLVLGHGQDDC